MGSSLRELLMNAKFRSNTKVLFPEDPNHLGEDGVDHINISNQAKTELGQSLSQDVFIEFEHPIFGKFNTLTGFWYYISSTDRKNECRTLNSNKLRRMFKDVKLPSIKNFRAIILEAYWLKITQNEAIQHELLNTELPLDCYFITANGTVRTRPKNHRWLLQGLNDMRNALKKGVDFDYTRYLDDPNSGIYDYVDDHVVQQTPEVTPKVEKQPTEDQEQVSEPEVIAGTITDSSDPIGYEEAPVAA